ncbi:NADPH-dependent 2,4-dienoyl-CoA reductase/sulfur reductase-like enzyme [Nocardia transvalensis]|uniref:NADPH-dependent 2,4-dienoyl-CoA reductase/sulfur reductase-like enzyme n=1 Tax=Nocardia transvalensis TaxID=37333 RepID=A0A7W9PG65_9NOCA|nr:FAD-dependent oxidoreductase [Nocardia transvalensis]MBB5915470.1 NADPH-dependent 2,4-dienoyl-CoA reductase/sulfur reductase-like enzyme [Nocardia transvalensis]
MTRHTDVLIVGASVSGLSTAEALRRNGFDGKITLLGAEPHLPYDRPPLSKQILSGAWRPERTLLRPPRMLADLNLELLLGRPATGLDVASRTVHTAAGAITAETIVIATGSTPRTLPAPPGLRGLHVLRTLDDALALRDDLAVSGTVVVVGEGVLGAEIAATARQSGREVTMTGLLHAPMVTQLGDLAAGRLADLHTGNGVRLRLGVGVDGLTDRGGEVTGVTLASGETLPADLVVVAIGAVPVTDWLAGSGLTLENGVVCDAECRAAEGIYAVGDVARWHDLTADAAIRLENRTHAAEQAGVVAANITGAERPYRPVPYFWTDQYTTKIQVHGTITPDAEAVVVDGDPATDRFVIRYERAGTATAVLGWNMPKQARMQRQQLVDRQRPATPAHAP